MWPAPSTLELPANVFAILSDLLRERTGLHYDAGKRDLLAEKLSPLAAERGFGTFLDYYYLLKYGPDDEAEWIRVQDALSVPETYFWREVRQIEALVNEILPRYVSKVAAGPLRIWCAACASGEEPLTIAMALNEAGWFERSTIEIDASDASAAAIQKARQGFYRERAFRVLPGHLQAKYFTPEPGGWRVSAELLSRVKWSQANLVNADDIAAHSQVPFLFCRNVFIYFADAAIRRTIGQFARGMQRPGYLFVGASESLLRLTDEFELQEVGDAFVYFLKPKANESSSCRN